MTNVETMTNGQMQQDRAPRPTGKPMTKPARKPTAPKTLDAGKRAEVLALVRLGCTRRMAAEKVRLRPYDDRPRRRPRPPLRRRAGRGREPARPRNARFDPHNRPPPAPPGGGPPRGAAPARARLPPRGSRGNPAGDVRFSAAAGAAEGHHGFSSPFAGHFGAWSGRCVPIVSKLRGTGAAFPRA